MSEKKKAAELNDKEIENINSGYEEQTVTIIYYNFDIGDCFKKGQMIYKVKNNKKNVKEDAQIDVLYKTENARYCCEATVTAKFLSSGEYLGKNII